jgi:hypothetical protein
LQPETHVIVPGSQYEPAAHASLAGRHATPPPPLELLVALVTLPELLLVAAAPPLPPAPPEPLETLLPGPHAAARITASGATDFLGSRSSSMG